MSADIESLRARVAELQARLTSYSGGDRPSSPPASLLRECIDAERTLGEAVDAGRKGAHYTVGDGLGAPVDEARDARDTAPAWAAIGEIAAAVGLDEDAPTQEVIDAVKRSEERGRKAGIAWAVSFLREHDAGIARACANLIESEAKCGAK